MSQRRPPLLATWLLQRLGDPYLRDALIGDLIEEYRQGRSYAWYWSQTLTALFVAARNRARRHPPAFPAYTIWCAVLLITGLVFNSAVLWLFALDPSLPLLMHARAKRKRAHPQRPEPGG